MSEHKLMKFFAYKHLVNEDMQTVSKQFCFLAEYLDSALTDGPEKTVALRKLLEAKDAGVRATLHPGG